MKRILPMIVLVALAAAAVGAWWFSRGTNSSAAALGGSGTIEATTVNISTQASGRILSAEVSAGDRVTKGQVLFKLDRTLADYTVDQAKAGLRAAEATLRQARDDDKSAAEIAQAQAQADQAGVQVRMAQTQAAYAVVKAPIDAAVLDVSANPGENAAPGQTLAVLGDVAHLTVSVFVPEPRIGEVKVGQTGSLTTDSSDRTFTCKVVSIASEAEFTPASIETKDQRVKLVYEVRLDVYDAGGTLKPGMPANVRLEASPLP